MNLKSYLTKAKIYLASQKTGIKISKEKQLALSLALLLVTFCTPIALGQNQQNSQVSQRSEDTEKQIEVTPIENKTETPAVEPTPSPEKTPQTSPAKAPTPKRSTTQARPSPKQTSNQGSQTQTPSRPASNPATAPSQQASGILGLINQVRSQNGLNALSYNTALNSAAKAKSQDMLNNNYFSHTSPEGKSDFEFVKESGYAFAFAGSNIAKGNFSETSVFNAWMNSSGHKANILNPNAREFGYGVAGQYYTMFVAAR